ncbi:MAG TPA: tol-pal system protein YbgF [Methylocella sp.]|nr:tol-pal system protein YbgF [Methylocella sp.]
MIFSKTALPMILQGSRIAFLAIGASAAAAVMAPSRLAAEDVGTKYLNAEPKEGVAQIPVRVAQGYGRPPGEIGEPGDLPYPGEQPDGSQLLVRIGRLESQIREINGQIEQMQFETRKLEEQLRKFQEDVDFRFHEGGSAGPPARPPQKRSEAPETQSLADAQSIAPGAAAPASRGSGRGDAFDPSQNPTAPGAPRPLGSLSPSGSANPAGPRRTDGPQASIDQSDPGAPLDLSNGRSRPAGPPAATPPVAMAPAPSGMTTPGGTMIAGPRSSREEFDIALAYLKQRAYENAEKSFAGFLEKNPKSKFASDALYYLGESFYLRGRQREAAEQYLKISTQYPDSPRAPEALLRLGQSLNALGAKEQACATYGELTRKYPNAPAMVKVGAEREAKRAQC